MFRRFMEGRYGRDQLNNVLLGAFIVLFIIGMITNVEIIYTIGIVLAILCIFRMMSKNFDRRRSENEKFMKFLSPVINWFRLRRTMHQDKEHCYFKCPRCGQNLRVPRGKGTLTITCRSCGASFKEKT